MSLHHYLPRVSQRVQTRSNITNLDSPSRRAGERRKLASQYEGILEIEVVSSPEQEPEPEVFDDIQRTVPESEGQGPVTPLTLGTSRFRRTQALPELSSPVTSHMPIADEIVLESLSQQPLLEPNSNTILSIEPGQRQSYTARTSSGRQLTLRRIPEWKKIIAKQNQRDALQAQKDSYYGVDIHGLLNRIEANSQFPIITEYPLFLCAVNVDIMTPLVQWPARSYGQINTARLNSSTSSATSGSIAILCAG